MDIEEKQRILKELFVKTYTNRYPAKDYKKNLDGSLTDTFFLYGRADMCKWSEEAFLRGDDYFYVEPVDPRKPNGKLVLAEPKYVYVAKRTLTPEEYCELFGEEDL